MLIKCPVCGSKNSLDSLLEHDEASQLIASALSMSPIGKQLIKYLGLFRPEKSDLSFSRVAKLLNELLPMIESQSIQRDGKVYQTTQEMWERALNTVINARNMRTLKTPLKTHGYLLEVLVTESLKQPAKTLVMTREEHNQGQQAQESKTLQSLKALEAMKCNG